MKKDMVSTTSKKEVELSFLSDESEEGAPLSEELIIKTETNLAALPFFALSRQDMAKRTTLEYYANFAGGEALWQVTANAKYGFPGPFDRKVFKAVEYLISQQGLPIQNPVRFSIYQIAKILGGEVSGRLYTKIKQALERIVLTGVKSEGIFYSKRDKCYISDTFHIYERVILKNQLRPDGKIAETNYLFLGNWYLTSLNAFYIRPLDFHFYRSLKSDIAGKLYELAGLKFYGVLRNQGEYWRPSYLELCALLPITPQRHFSYAKKQLKAVHDELIASNFIAKVKWEKEAAWYIRYYPGSRALKEFEHSRLTLVQPLQANKKGQLLDNSPGIEGDLVGLLVERGVSREKAVNLSRGYSEIIPEKCEIFDWILDYRPELVRSNPPGFLVRMIEGDWVPPEGFMTKAQIKEEKRKDEERRRDIEHQNKERDYEEWRRMSPEEKIAGDLWVWQHDLRNEGRRPTPEEIEEKKRQLIASLPSDEEYRRVN